MFKKCLAHRANSIEACYARSFIPQIFIKYLSTMRQAEFFVLGNQLEQVLSSCPHGVCVLVGIIRKKSFQIIMGTTKELSALDRQIAGSLLNGDI